MNDLKFSKYSPKISNCSYNNIKSFSENRERDVMLASGSTAKFIVTLKVFMTSISLEVSRRIASARKKETNCATMTSFPWSLNWSVLLWKIALD